MKSMRKIIEIDEERCDGCGQCVLSCAEGAIQVINGKAKLVSEIYCDGLGACLGECPQGALNIIEREAAEFDPEAVEHYLKEKEEREKAARAASGSMGCGCPSSNIRMFEAACKQANEPVSREDAASALAHWPVQIRLIPPNAPFLKGADLLIAADCAPVAYPNFHRDFVQGKVVMLGCPKFDNVMEYVQKFTEIFKTSGIRSVTVLDMEVPCCSALPIIVKKAMEACEKQIPMEEIVIGVRGDIIKRKKMAA
jgi:ferredoxin